LGVALITNISGPGCSTCGTGNTSYDYDPANNNLLSKTENGQTTQYGNYDAKGQKGYMIEAAGTADARRTDYVYDSRFFDRVTEMREPSVINTQPDQPCTAGVDCRLTQRSFDEWGNRISETVSGFAPDGTPVSRTTTWEYNGPYHQLSRVDGPRTDVSDITLYRYYPDDPAAGSNRGQLMEIEDANGVLVRSNIQYTPTGKVASEDRPNGLRLSYTYYYGNDRLETLTETDTTAGLSRTTRWTYLPTGEVESITRGEGTADATRLSFSYDDARRLTRISDGAGNYIEYLLDTEGNRLEENRHDAGGTLRRQLRQTFDLYNRLDTASQATENRDLDFAPDGTLDRATDGNGRITDYSYDALRRLTQAVQDAGGSDPATADATTRYAYDHGDRLTRVTDPNNGTTTYAYDDLGNLVTQVSPDTGTTRFTHDAAGRLATLTYPSGARVHYRYDLSGQVDIVELDQGGSLTRLFDVSFRFPFGDIGFGTFGNGLYFYRWQDLAGRPIWSYSGPWQQWINPWSSYDGNGNLLQYTGTESPTFTYDALDRLDTASSPAFGSRDYDYDRNGNRTRRVADGTVTAYAYLPASNRMDTLDGTPVNLDANGNTLALRGMVLGYTPDNRLATAGGVARYGYNALGQLTRKDTRLVRTRGGLI